MSFTSEPLHAYISYIFLLQISCSLVCVLGKPNLLSGWKRFSQKSIVWWETYFRGDLIARLSLTDNQLGRRPTVKPSLVTRSHCQRWLGRPLWDGRLEPWHCFSEVASLEDKLWGEVGAGWRMVYFPESASVDLSRWTDREKLSTQPPRSRLARWKIPISGNKIYAQSPCVEQEKIS